MIRSHDKEPPEAARVHLMQQIAAVLWPSFLGASVITTVVFAVADPHLISFSVSRISAYSIGFFVFWIICALACWGTSYVLKPVPPRKKDFYSNSDIDLDDIV